MEDTGNALDAFADYMIQHSNMSRAQNFTTSIGSLGADRSVKILKKLEKRKR